MKDNNQLPPLPEPEGFADPSCGGFMAYTADQMRAYALQARAQVQGAPVAWCIEAQVADEWVVQNPIRFTKQDAELDAPYYTPGTALRIRPLAFGDTAPQPAQATQAEVTDEQIKMLIPCGDAWKYEVGFPEAIQFARAILALRPAQVAAPMSEIDIEDDDSLRFVQRVLESDAPKEDRQSARDTVAGLRKRVRKAHHGITAQATQAEVTDGIRPEDFTVDVVVKPMGGFAPVNTQGVRVTHKPTGISVTCDAARSQHTNRHQAIETLRTILAQQPATPEPVYWEWRHLSAHPDTVDFGQWSKWKRVEARSAIHTIDDALAEFRTYIAQGYKYELRALHTHPAPSVPATGEPVGYQEIFNAIAAATEVQAGAVAVSVKAFTQAIGAIYTRPAPSVPDSIDPPAEDGTEHDYGSGRETGYAEGWNACRAAMLAAKDSK